jgi:excisionase family DNA binding protein
MVDGAMSRKAATSRVVHQSAGSLSPTGSGYFALGGLFPGGARWPDDGDGDTPLFCVRKPGPGLAEQLLTVGQVAELLGTTERFPRRLIAERRIRFVRVGKHVRIPESALSDFIAAGLVEPLVRHRTGGVA